jgi:hypothetical protein
MQPMKLPESNGQFLFADKVYFTQNRLPALQLMAVSTFNVAPSAAHARPLRSVMLTPE